MQKQLTTKRQPSPNGTQPLDTPELLTVDEVSKILRVDATTTRRWVKQGALEAIVLPHVNKRRAYRIRRETLDTVLTTPAL